MLGLQELNKLIKEGNWKLLQGRLLGMVDFLMKLPNTFNESFHQGHAHKPIFHWKKIAFALATQRK